MWQLVNWLKNNEWLPLWIEGIALVLIFVWDRFDARAARKETKAQIDIAIQQSQFMLNSERAWLTVDLAWTDAESLRIAYLDSQGSTGGIAVRLRLDIRNDGRTPTWIENVSCGMEIYGRQVQPETSIEEFVEPLGAEKSRKVYITLTCPGRPETGQDVLRVHGTVHYRDIFKSRQMELAYFIEPLTYSIRKAGHTVNPLSPDTWFKDK